MSSILIYVTVVLWRQRILYPDSPVGIMAQVIHVREEWFVIRSGFHPKDAIVRHVIAHFLDYGMYHYGHGYKIKLSTL
jgi:phosphoglycerol transferase MdoB-like AlkP superfamily enzyme